MWAPSDEPCTRASQASASEARRERGRPSSAVTAKNDVTVTCYTPGRPRITSSISAEWTPGLMITCPTRPRSR